MNWLAFIMAFQIGTSSNSVSINNPQYQEYASFNSPKSALYTRMDMGIELFNCITIKSFMKSYQTYCTDIYFNPYKIDYGFDTYLFYKGFTLGFTHECDHPVLSSIKNKEQLIVTSNTEIYLKFEHKFTF
jgi:hypothetical protein